MRRFLLLPLALLGLATLGLASANAFTTVHQADASARGVIVKLTATSIAVRRNRHHRLTCSLGSTSPSLQLFAYGDRVKIACASGMLVAIADLPSHTRHGPNSEPQPATTTTASDEATLAYAVGPITARSDGAISVQTMTCTTGSGSPSTAGFTVGTVVRMYCKDGVLFAINHQDAAPSTTTTTTTAATPPQNISGISGSITALSGGSITVTGGDGGKAVLSCPIGNTSPSTSGFAVGDSVRMYCVNGVLYQLRHNDPQPTTTASTTTSTTSTVPQNATSATGTLTALGSSSITVGDLTCTIGNTSPSTSGFAVGNNVQMYCVNGSLYALSHR